MRLTPLKSISIKYIVVVLISVLIGGCTSQIPHIQQGNTTGQVQDNRWDYFTNSPTHYTSYQRTMYARDMQVINENTDAFSAIFNLDRSKSNGTVIFNRAVVPLSVASKNTATRFFNEYIKGKPGIPANATLYSVWDEYYQSRDGKLLVAVNYEKQIIVTSFTEGNSVSHIAYLPSRYLACKKITSLQVAHNQAIFAELLVTALVAGVQSYTSYATVSVYDSYGNFGYATVKDYAWAGDRASDALTSIFSGSASQANLTTAWDLLNCY